MIGKLLRYAAFIAIGVIGTLVVTSQWSRIEKTVSGHRAQTSKARLENARFSITTTP